MNLWTCNLRLFILLIYYLILTYCQIDLDMHKYRTIRFVIPFSISYVLKYPTQASMEDLVFYAGGSLYQGLKLYEFQLWNGTWPWRSTPSLSFNCQVAQTSLPTCFAVNFSFVAKLPSLIRAKQTRKLQSSPDVNKTRLHLVLPFQIPKNIYPPLCMYKLKGFYFFFPLC